MQKKILNRNLYELKHDWKNLCLVVEISKNLSNRFEKMKWCRNVFLFEWNDVGIIFYSNEKCWNDNKFLRNDVGMIISPIPFKWDEKNYWSDHNFSEILSIHFAA